MPDVDLTSHRDVRDLFVGEPEGFITARDELVKRLKVDGDDDVASAVKRLRKPTVAAWAVDRAARTESRLIDDLLAAGARLAGAQRQALSGKRGSDGMRRATEERRALIRQLTDAAVRALDDGGRPGESSRDEIAGTFEAATLDPAVAELVRAGVLERTVKPSSGLGSVEGFTVLEGGGGEGAKPPARKAASAKREAQQSVRAAEKAQAAADKAADLARGARAAADEAARQAEERKTAALAAEREAKRLAAEAKTARARAERAVRRLEN
jgi:hypothetical protein